MDKKVYLGIIGILIVLSLVFILLRYYDYVQHKQNTILSELKSEVESSDNIYTPQEKQLNHKTRRLLVHITGAVKNPGIIHISNDSRVYEIIKNAGGTLPDADTDVINLVQRVRDGDKLYIPFQRDTKDIKEKEKENWYYNVIQNRDNEQYTFTNKDLNISNDGNMVKNISNDDYKTQETNLVNLNTATKEELQSLPRVGPKTAEKIIEYRNKHNGFNSVEELKKVNRIGSKTFENLKDKICVK